MGRKAFFPGYRMATVDTTHSGSETASMAAGAPLLISRLYVDLLRVDSAI
jgi:hypothetical protein